MSHPVTVVIGLGSNVEPEIHLPRALAALRQAVAVTAASGLWASDPVGAPGSPRFWNAALRADTDRPALRLKAEVLRPVEAALGRRRTADRNAPRTIDLDLVLYGDLVVDDPASGLVLPDPDLLARAHVALPAAEVWPEAVHPATGETLAAIAARLAIGAGLARIRSPAGWPGG